MERLLPDAELIEKILHTTPSIIYIYDLVHNENIYVNEVTKKYLGYTPEELFNMGPELTKNMYHPEDLSQALATNLRIKKFKDEERLPVKFRIRHKDGYFKWFTGYEAVFKRDPKTNKPIQKIGNIIDIDDQVRKEEELQAIIDTTPSVFFILSSDNGTYLKAYPETSWYTLNMGPQDYLFKTIEEVWKDSCSPLVEEFYSKLPEIRRSKTNNEFHFTYEVINPTTKLKHMFETIITKINEDRLLATVRDITETRDMLEMKVGVSGLKEQINRLIESKRVLS